MILPTSSTTCLVLVSYETAHYSYQEEVTIEAAPLLAVDVKIAAGRCNVIVDMPSFAHYSFTLSVIWIVREILVMVGMPGFVNYSLT